jgi:hypothetical protein
LPLPSPNPPGHFAKRSRASIYSFALYTSGEDDFVCVCASANTEEGLVEKEHQYSAREFDPSRLRWSAPDWKCHDFSQPVRELALPEGSSVRRDREVYKAFVTALRQADQAGAFGRGAAREQVTLLMFAAT